MCRMGLLLACQHYPDVSDRVSGIDAQLRLWLSACGTDPSALAVYAAHDGALPRRADDCDVWVVSGTILATNGPSQDQAGPLFQFLRAAAATGRPVFALNHGEHVVHDALAAPGAPAPETPRDMRSIRNPFRSFHCRDALYRFDPATRRVEALTRPRALCSRTIFGALRRAA